MHTYVVLRDLSNASVAGPFETGLATVEEVVTEPRVDVERLDKADVQDVARDPQVRSIAEVMPTRLVEPVASSEAAATAAWGIGAVGADTSARTGAGVVVAVLDTGIDADHPAFAGVTLTQIDFTGSGLGDRNGHGTHCAGTIFGRDVDGTRIGVARGVDRALIGKVLADDGRGNSAWMFDGLQWAVNQGAHVVSISIELDFPNFVRRVVDEEGWPVDLATSRALEAYRATLHMFEALMAMIRSREAFGAGTMVVAAAGNGSRRNVDPDHEIGVALPAAADGVVSVAAVGQSPQGLQVAAFSNTFAQISAPGVGIVSAATGGGLRSLDGTSMACPHVAGLVALWREEVLASPLPANTATVTAKLLATAATDGFAAGIDVADRGVGLAVAP